jgi:hypothetical protein
MILAGTTKTRWAEEIVPDEIRRIDYYYTSVPDKPGEGARILVALRGAGVNLIGVSAFPHGARRSQLDLIPEDSATFAKAARAAGLVARLTPGVRLAAAEAALDAVRRHLDDEGAIPESERKGRQVRLLSASGMMPMPAEQKSMTYTFLAILMGLILSLACTNLAIAPGEKVRVARSVRVKMGLRGFRQPERRRG